LAPYFGLGRGLPLLTLASALASEGLEACVAAEGAILDNAGASQVTIPLPAGVVEVTDKIRSCTTTEEYAAAITEVIAKGPDMRAVVSEIAAEFASQGGAPEAARRIAAVI